MGGYLPLILATLVGFFLLAYLLLAPIANFLDREREASREWTPDRIAERLREREADQNGEEADDASDTKAASS
jgi:flagellar motor component MotA